MGIAMLSGCGLKTQSGEVNSVNEGIVENANEPSVALIYLPNGKGICSGVVVGLKALLTAAHCVKGLSGRFEARTKKGRFSTYSDSIHYRNYANAGTVDDVGDIAMMIFDQTIAEPEHVTPIGSNVKMGSRVKMAGYGCDDIVTRQGSGVLRSLTTKLSDTDRDGFLAISENFKNATRTVTGGGTCFGDSGGPLWQQNPDGEWMLVGDVHAGGQEGNQQISYFTNLIKSSNYNYLQDLNDTHNLGMRFM